MWSASLYHKFVSLICFHETVGLDLLAASVSSGSLQAYVSFRAPAVQCGD